jgi:hypothetical protein
MKILATFLLCFIAKISAQETDTRNQIHIDGNKLLKLKVDAYIFEYAGSFWDDGKEPKFNDDRNLGFTTTLVNPSTKKEIDLPNEHVGDTLKLIPKSIVLDAMSKHITVKGVVSGGWTGGGSDVHIYIGERRDTVQYISLSPSLEAEIYYKGEKLTETVIIDTIPAFYLKNFVRVNSENANSGHLERAFEIEAPINENSILALGQNDCFAELFKIGELLELIDPKYHKKNKRNEN